MFDVEVKGVTQRLGIEEKPAKLLKFKIALPTKCCALNYNTHIEGGAVTNVECRRNMTCVECYSATDVCVLPIA
jgi:hypothetical protein